jgi:hypothetical protein
MYFFVRPKRSSGSLVLPGTHVKAPQVRKTVKASKLKVAHMVHITHRDYVEPPLTDWLKEAFETSNRLSSKGQKGKRNTKKYQSHQIRKLAAAFYAFLCLLCSVRFSNKFRSLQLLQDLCYDLRASLSAQIPKPRSAPPYPQ